MRTKRPETRFERELRLMRRADEAERKRAFNGFNEEQAEFEALESIGMSAASVAVLTEEPHERMWNEIERMGEAHFTEEDER